MDATVTKPDGTTYTVPSDSVNVGTQTSPIIVTARQAQDTHNQNSALLDKTLATINSSAGVNTLMQTPGIKKAQDEVTAVNSPTYSDPFTQALDSMTTSANASTKALIGSIQSDKANQVTQSNQAFERYKHGLETLGVQTNMAQSTPSLFLGQILQAENDQVQKINALDAAEKKAIAEAEIARDNQNFNLMTEKMNYVKGLRDEKNQALASIKDAQRQDLSTAVTMADKIAPFLYDAVNEADDADKEAIIQAIGQKYNIPLDVLVSSLSTLKSEKDTAAYTQQRQKEQDALDKANTLSLINSRNNAASGDISSMNAGDRKQYGLQLLNKAFTTQGLKDETGTPYVDNNGYIIPSQFKNLLKEAISTYGVSRNDIIDAFGDQIYLPAAKQYGLTASEIKALGGTESSGFTS